MPYVCDTCGESKPPKQFRRYKSDIRWDSCLECRKAAGITRSRQPARSAPHDIEELLGNYRASLLHLSKPLLKDERRGEH